MANKNTDDKIIVLGKTFNSEEERRSYFREELRKKLPELKKIEGFPIGEDEDILNLSDPPYYTACPNPWINDFISEWEAEKRDLEKFGKREINFDVNEPYADDVSEGKNNPIYNAHSYHTKVPHPAIMRYILHYTQPGDIVFDGFAGTGMTGVASSLSDKPDSNLKFLFEKSDEKIKWGKRKSICSDLSPIASLISALYNVNGINRINFEKNVSAKIKVIEQKLNWLYHTKHHNGVNGIINYIVWSEIFTCPVCSSDVNFWECAVFNNDVEDVFNCKSCNSSITKRSLGKRYETVIDEITGEAVKKILYKPVFVNYKVGTKLYEKPVDDFDLELIEKIKDIKLKNLKQLQNKFQEGDKTKEYFNKGIHRLKDLYTHRTLVVLSELYDVFETTEEKALFTSSIVNLSKTARYKFKRSGNVPMSGTIYVSSLIAESNVFNAFKSKIKSFKNAFSVLGNSKNNLNGINSATNLPNISSSSIDYIFVDPPFGSNLMYSELSAHWENWINIKTNIKKEAIENRTQKKSTFEYQSIIQLSIKEFFRILKPGKWMTVEFSNTSAAVWNSIQVAIQNSGFIVSNIAALDKKQGSYNAVMNATSVKQDLVISCYKPSLNFDKNFSKNQFTDIGIWEFVLEHLNHLPIHLKIDNATSAIVERNPKILYDRLISFYIQRGIPVPIDASKFQLGLRERFIERDGMFFTNEQVQEYDIKKSQVPNFSQLSIFVTNEQDSIYWLRNLLIKSNKTESDLHPYWMKEVAGNMRKGDALPEMRTILEENFLKDENGKWYVPDPENEADLEKLRNKRLLKQFDIYKTEAANPRSKIKECRVEALRAGFKQCYQDKDFRTIVTIGDSIPNNLLMEDEVLLQFYDIAISRL
jgi:DNA modification methylase